MSKHQNFIENLKKLNSTKEERQKRGRLFETKINEIFEEEGTLVKRSYYTSDNKSEQIDGAIKLFNRIMLFEVKWVESSMAASELYSFIGKVENKFTGTIGVFISKETLSENFIKSLNKGRRQSIIPIHGQDLELFFDSEVRLSDYIMYAIENLSLSSVPHIPFSSFLEDLKLKKIKENKKLPSSNKDKIHAKIFSSQKNYADLINLSSSPEKELDLLFSNYVSDYQKIIWTTHDKADYLAIADNISTYLENYYKSSNDKASLAKIFLDNYLELKPYNSYTLLSFPEELIKLVAKTYTLIDSNFRQNFEKRLLQVFNKIFGNYHKENAITSLIKHLIDKVHRHTKLELIKLYAIIFTSDRKSKFEQKMFANQLFKSGDKDLIQGVALLIKKTNNDIQKFNNLMDDEFKDDPVKRITSDLRSLGFTLGFSDMNKWKEFVENKINHPESIHR